MNSQQEIINKMINMLSDLNESKSISIYSAKKLFLATLTAKNNNSDTIKYYKNIFYRIDNFFKVHQIKETNQINDNLLISLINQSLNEQLSANYINKMISSIKYMMKTLAEQKIINPVTFTVSKLKEPEKRLNVIEHDNLLKIFNFIETQDLKTNLIVSMLLATGLRRKELSLIKLKNISLEEQCILIEDSKTKQTRYVFFTKELGISIKLYVDTYNPVTYLFEKDFEEPISPRSISRILNKIKICLNLEELSAHQFRHTFGTIVYEASKDIELTRQLLGHSNYMMTKRYVHHSKDKLKSQYDQFNPFKSCLK